MKNLVMSLLISLFLVSPVFAEGIETNMGNSGVDNTASIWGMQKLQVYYVDSDTFGIYPGLIEIEGKLYKVTSAITKDIGTITDAEIYYIYVAADSDGELEADDVSFDTTIPTLSSTYYGRYDDSKRCIGHFLAKTTTTMVDFRISDRGFYTYLGDPNTDMMTSLVSSSDTIAGGKQDISDFVAFGDCFAYFLANNTTGSGHYNYNSIDGLVTHKYWISNDKSGMRNQARLYVTSDLEIYLYDLTSGSDTYAIYCLGQFYPKEVFNR